MFRLFRIILVLLVLLLPLPLMACGPEVHIVKKPKGLRNENPDPFHPYMNAQDRLKWKSVLNWCDECDERSRLYLERFGQDDGTNGGVFIYPIGHNQYIVDIQCEMSMQQSEHIYYKVTEHADTVFEGMTVCARASSWRGTQAALAALIAGTIGASNPPTK